MENLTKMQKYYIVHRERLKVKNLENYYKNQEKRKAQALQRYYDLKERGLKKDVPTNIICLAAPSLD